MLPSKCGIPHIDTGTGRIVLRLHGALPVFSELCSTYPLKLLSPRVGHSEGVAIVYVLTYGGGLVGGDTIQLAIDVGPSGKLVLLTQVDFFITRLYGVTLNGCFFFGPGVNQGFQDTARRPSRSASRAS